MSSSPWPCPRALLPLFDLRKGSGSDSAAAMETEMESDDFGELYTDSHLPFCPPQARASRRQSASAASSSDDEDDERRHLVSGGAEFVDSVMREDGEGESEDDGLHIILNDHDDCPAGVPGLLNGSGVGCFDGDGDTVVVAGGDLSSKESKRAAGLSSDGFGQLPHLSRYRYVRPHAKASGTSSSMTDGRGNWDSNEGGPPTFSSSTAHISPLHYMISATARDKPEFFLRRNRTIFDVDIDKFDQKPWMSAGVDKSDFFNFGLDEESWRVYCTDLKVLYHKQSRQQTSVKNGINVHTSSPNKGKVSGNEVHHEFQSSKCAPAEICSTKRGESSLHSLESSEVGEWILEMPKGRAIQVEDSMIERMPSMKLIHTQYRDADVVIQIPLQDATDNAQPELDLILEKPPLNFEKIESDMNDEHLKEHQDNASADDSRSSLTRNSQAKSLCSLVSQNEVETHANCREPSAEKVSDGEESGSNSLAKDCESPDLDHDTQSFSGQFDDDKDHFEVSENGVSLETLDSCSYHSRADSLILEDGECCSHQKQFCNSGLKRKAEHNGASPANFNHDCHSEEHATIKHRACTSRQPLSTTNYKRGGLSCYEDEKVGASEAWKHDKRQQIEKPSLTSSIKPNIDRKAHNDYFDSRHYNLEKQLPKDELRGHTEYISNSRHFEQGIRGRSISNFFSEEKRHRYKVDRKDNEPKFRCQRDKWLNWEYDKLYYKSHQHEKPGPYSDQPESSQDRFGRRVPGIDNRHKKWTKLLFHQNHHSGCKKTKRHCIHALPLSDHATRNSSIPDNIYYYRAPLQGYDDHDSYRGHADEWGPDDGTHRGLKFNDEGDWLSSSGKFQSYPLSRARSPSDENIWGENASKDRIDSNLYYEGHDHFLVEHAISNKTRGSKSCRSLGQIHEHSRKLLLDKHLAGRRNCLESKQCTDLDVEMSDGTLKFGKSIHLSYVRRKFHKEEDMRGHRHRCLSSGYSPIYGNYENLPAGRVREALKYLPKVEKNECIEAVSHGDGDLCPKTSAETNGWKMFKKLQVVGNQRDSCFAARKSLVIQNQRCTVLREKKSKISEISQVVKLNCSSKLEYKTLESSDVPTEKAKTVEENEEKRILETLQKMERRKERFKEPITSEKEQMGSSKHRKSEAPVEAAELKLQRPVRKRRWGKEGASIIPDDSKLILDSIF